MRTSCVTWAIAIYAVAMLLGAPSCPAVDREIYDDPGWDNSVLPGTFRPLRSRMALQYHLDRENPSAEDRTRIADDYPFLLEYEQRFLLGEELWPRVRCDAFLASLEPMLVLPDKPEQANYDTQLDRIVVRLVELKSQKARHFVLADIRRPQPFLSVGALTCLPEDALPDMDDIFRQHARRAPSGGWSADLFKVAPLIARYGTRALLPDVETLYMSSEGGWACDIQKSLLRYLIKHKPEFGLAALERALTFRGGSGKNNCYGSVILETLSGMRGEAVESFAIRKLEYESLLVAYSAASYLVRDGSSTSRKRVIEFCNRLPKEDNPRTGPDMNRAGLRQLILGEFLVVPRAFQGPKLSAEELDALQGGMSESEKSFFSRFR